MNYHHELSTYIPLKRYFSINKKAILLAYGMLKRGYKIYDILHDEGFYNKVFQRSDVSWAYRNLDKNYINATGADCKNTKMWSKLLNNPEKLIKNKIILNLHSSIGDEALKAATILSRKLIDKKYKVVVTDGIRFSNDVVNFSDNKNDISPLFDGDILVFMATNAVAAKEYRQGVFNQLIEGCWLKSIPVICTSNEKWGVDKKEWKAMGTNVVNLEFVDEYKNPNEVLKDILG